MGVPAPPPAGEPTHDTALVAAARAGSREAFQQLFHRYFRLVAVMLYQKINRTPDVEDLTQETFLRAWRGLSRLREPGCFVPWLLSIARRLVTDWHRSAGRELNAVSRPLETLARDEDPSRRMAAAEEHDRLLAALDRLPDQYRLVLTLRFLEGLSPQDIARRLGEPDGTVRNRVFRGLKKLAALMDERRTKP